MDAARRNEYGTRLEIALLKYRQKEFQEFFANLMEHARPTDFTRVKQAGPKGDGGCDGYLRSTATIFQAYAPNRIQPSRLHAKIEEDLRKAAAAGLEFRKWIFVHNSLDGLHADSLALVQRLTRAAGVDHEIWGREHLWAEVQQVPAEYLDVVLLPYCTSLASSPAQPEVSTHSVPALTQPTSASAAPLSILQHRALLEQVDAQAAQLRKYLDMEGQSLWDEVKAHLAALSFDRAIAAGQRLEQWLNQKGAEASPELRGRTLILLADLEVIQTADDRSVPAEHIARARKLQERARSAFGSAITDEDAARLISLSAKLCAVEGNPERAMREMEGHEAPAVISLWVAILIDLQRFRDADVLLGDRPLHEKWADSAVAVWVATGKIEQARATLEWAQTREVSLYRRCLLQFARSIAISVQTDMANGGHVVPGRITDDVRERLQDVLTALHPMLCDAEYANRTWDGVETESLSIAAMTAHRLGDLGARERYTALLEKARPVPLSFARFVRAGFVAAPEDLPERLRKEHPRSREAAMLAAIIDGTRLAKVADAIVAMRSLAEAAHTLEEREEACEQLLEVSGLADPAERCSVDDFVSVQLGSNHKLVRFQRAARLIWARDPASAEPIVSELRDEQDILWWQLQSKLEYLKGEKAAAADALASACRLMPCPELLRPGIGLAESAGREDLQEELLRALLAFEPDDERAASRLASLLMGQGRFGEAAQILRGLRERNVEEPAHALNLALCLRNDGQPNDAIRFLDQLCARPSADIRAILSRAQLLREIGKADHAFQSLQPYRDSFWDNHEYLLAYVGFGFAAGQDAVAHQAFARLMELRGEGKIPLAKLLALSPDEVAEHVRQLQERQRAMDEAILHGHVPWLAVEHARGHPSVAGWRFRTQEMVVGDAVHHRALFAVYATNSFTVRSSANKPARLEEISCPPRGSDVVVDLTALLTLSRLGLLDRAREYFARMYVPSGYISWFASEGVRLAPQQPLRIASVEAIREAVDRAAIRVCSRNVTDLTIIDEYGQDDDKESTTYHLIDLLEYMRDAGHISSAEFDRTRVVANKPRVAAPGLGKVLKSPFAIRFDTLRTIAEIGLLEVVIRSELVCISDECHEQLKASLLVVREQQRLMAQHKELVELVGNEQWFSRLPAPSYARYARRSELDAVSISLTACETAVERNHPLLVDDRVCQMLALNHRRGEEGVAFGTDALLVGLLDSGLCSVEKIATHFIHLMRWRYRFLLPPVSVLLQIATTHTASPPGALLAEVACYVHDCMRDPGLFAGPEASDPPMPLAARYGNAWARIIGEFVIGLWLNESLTAETAEAFTMWAIDHALPGPASVLNPFLRHRIAELLPRFVLGSALAAVIGAGDCSRANHGLLMIADRLGISKAEYIRLVGEIIDVDFRSMQ